MSNSDRDDWMDWTPSVWGAKVEVLPEFTEMIRGSQLSDEDAQAISSAISEQGTRVFGVLLPSLGDGIELDRFDWSTSIDFGREYDGGAYMIGLGHEDVCDRYGIADPMMFINIESDSYSEKMGYDRSQEASVELAIDVLREFLSSLP